MELSRGAVVLLRSLKLDVCWIGPGLDWVLLEKSDLSRGFLHMGLVLSWILLWIDGAVHDFGLATTFCGRNLKWDLDLV